jgi:hypothetical protein
MVMKWMTNVPFNLFLLHVRTSIFSRLLRMFPGVSAQRV